MLALVRSVFVSCCCLALAVAQGERRPESFQLAIGLQQRGLHEEAAGYLVKFLREQPQHPLVAEAHYRLAQSRSELQQVDQAIESLQKALAAGGAQFDLRPEARYRLGSLLQQQNRHEPALAQFRALGSECAADHYLAVAVRYAEGEACRELGDDEGAATAFGAAAELATGERATFRFPALYQLGFARLRQRRYDGAAAAFAAASTAAPDDAAKAECCYLSGDAHLRLEQYDRSEQDLRQAMALGGDFADDAAYGLGWVALGRGDRQAALSAFGSLIAEHGDSPFVPPARLERARCCYQLQRYDEAQRELAPLLREGGALQQEARELQGLCALASGAGASAVETLQQALAAADAADRPRLSFALGEALANLGRWPEALAAYRDVPDDVPVELRGDALYGACHALHQLGRHEDSIGAAQAVLSLSPPHRSQTLAALAIAENRFALRDYTAAAKAYQALAADDGLSRTVAWKLAWCCYLQGDKAEAATRFGAVTADAEHGDAEEAMAMQALALYETGQRDEALDVADRYRARFRDGRFLDRTERIAARVLRQRGDLGAAQRRLSRAAAIASQKHGAEAAGADVAEQAELAYQQGDYRAADELFAQLIQRDDAIGARALAGRAWCAFELGADDACLQVLGQARQHPAVAAELPGLLELESALHHRRQEWPQAIAAAEAFLQRFADSEKAPLLRYALGVAKAQNGDQEGARAVFAALAEHGSYAEPDRVLYELAWACRRAGDEPAALETFERLAAATQDVELGGEARLFVGTALLAKPQPDLAAAGRWLEAVQGSHRPQALYRLGFAEFEAACAAAEPALQQSLMSSARDHFATVSQLSDAELRGEALYLGGECCRRLGDPAAALQRAQQLLRAAPEHARADRARLLLGECALLVEQPDLAIAPLEQFLQKRRAAADRAAEGAAGAADRADQARANLWLGQARLARREHAAAEQAFVAVTVASDGALAAEAQFRLGESRRQRGDLDGAADAFVKLPILYGDPQWVRAGLLEAGHTYVQLQQPDKAARFYRELVEKHAGSDEAKVAATRLPNR